MKARQYKQRARSKSPTYKPSGGYRPPPRQVYRPPVTSGSTGRYSPPAPPPRGGPGPIRRIAQPKPKPKPRPPSVSKFLTRDTGYQRQLQQLAGQLTDFGADVTRRRGTLESETQESRRALGKQRTSDLEDIEADFAARGMLRSGLYGGKVGEYEEEFGERTSDLETQLKRALARLEQERGQFGRKQTLSKQEAREQAIERRASKYGL